MLHRLRSQPILIALFAVPDIETVLEKGICSPFSITEAGGQALISGEKKGKYAKKVESYGNHCNRIKNALLLRVLNVYINTGRNPAKL